MKHFGVPVSKWSGASDQNSLIFMVIIHVVLFAVFSH